MGKLDELLKHQGNMDASLGVGYARGITPPGMSLDHAQRLPSRLQGVSKSKSTVEILVDKIQADPDQPREEFDADALARLSHSLKTQGQLQPIRVRWDEASSSYIIIMGERRCARRCRPNWRRSPASSTKELPIRRRCWRCSSSRTPSAKTSGRSSRRRRISD